MNPIDPRAGYFNTARELRAAMDQSKCDRLFANKDISEIVYILDTNMVEAYVRATKTSSSDSLSFGRLLNDAKAAFVNDRLTVEFLLSGRLPGQKCDTTYMSASHWNEILKRADTWALEMTRATRSVSSRSEASLGQFDNVIELLDFAKNVVPEEVVRAIGDAAVVERRLQAAFAGDSPKVRPLERSKYWDAATDHVRRDDFRKWRASLTALRQAHSDYRGISRMAVRRRTDKDQQPRVTQNIENDAWTLASIEALYRENPESCNDNRKVEFLFVTADRAIIEAVNKERVRLAREGIPYFVRHPRVYSPVLNFSNMNLSKLDFEKETPDTLRRVFLEVEQALDRLLVVDKWDERSTDYSDQWSTLKRNLRRWGGAARELAAINADYLSNDSETIRRVADMLNSSKALIEASSRLSTTIGQIRNEHVRVLSSEALRRLTRVLQAQIDLPAGIRAERRAPLKILSVDILESVRQILPDIHEKQVHARTLDELLDVLVSSHGTQEQIRRTIDEIGDHLRRRWNQVSSQLLAACVYLAVEAWDSARDCASRCRVLTTTSKFSIWKREANYCFAIASRLALSTASEFEAARDALQENIATWAVQRSGDARLAVLRDEVELAALFMAATVAQKAGAALATESDSPAQHFLAIIRDSDIRQNFDQAVTTMESVSRILEEEYSVPETEGFQTVQRLREQLYANLLGSYVARRALGQEISDEPANLAPLNSALQNLEEAYGGRPLRLHARIYRAVAMVQIARDELGGPAPTSELSDRANNALREALQNPDIPHCDQQQFIYLEHYVRSQVLLTQTLESVSSS